MKVAALRPPRLRTLESEEATRHATWTELFYDLVFVVAVANLGARLLNNISVGGVLAFIGYFVPLWWAWAGYTFYADRFDTDDLGQRILAVFQMIAIAMMAASISGGEADSSVAFAWSFVASRTLLLVMYWRARRHVPITRELVTGYIKGDSVAIAVWILSVVVPEPWRFALWAVGLAVSVATPYRLRKIQAKVPLDVEHLPERFGLFSILVLGESIAATVIGLSHHEWALGTTIAAALAVTVTAGMWWLYFDNMQGSVVRRSAEVEKAWKPTAWIYAHLPFACSIVIMAIGLEKAVDQHLDGGSRWLIAGGAAAAFLAMALISIANDSGRQPSGDLAKAKYRLIGAALLLILGLIEMPEVTWLLVLTLIAGVSVAGDVMINERTGEVT